MKYPHLFEPIQIGKTTVKNRIFMPPISTNLSKKGYITEDLIANYETRAKGGVGLIVTEVVTVEPTYTYLPGDMCIYDDSFIEGWKKLADAVHKYDCKLVPSDGSVFFCQYVRGSAEFLRFSGKLDLGGDVRNFRHVLLVVCARCGHDCDFCHPCDVSPLSR